MVLTLADRPFAESKERTVIPACLQARAPLNYEIRDENDHKIRPTLAGYKLKRHQTYNLIVRTQDKNAAAWKLRVLAPRSVLIATADDGIEGEGRMITFDTMAPPAGEYWKWFVSQVTTLPVRLDFGDGREPYKFSIPVVLLASRVLRMGSLLLAALVSLASNAIFQERLTLPSPGHMLLFGGAWVLVLFACFIWDQKNFYDRAQSFLPHSKLDGPRSIAKPAGTD